MNASTRLSTHYTVGDLIKTSTGIPNMPPESYLPNLRALANVLELLRQIDTFTIVSGFRSPAVNAAVGGAEASYHSEGLAADIIPDNISNQEFFYRIHNNPKFRNAVGEYIFYPLEHRSIHVSSPTAFKVGVALKELPTGGYAPADIGYDSSWKMELPGGAPLYLGLALGMGLILFAVYQSRKVA